MRNKFAGRCEACDRAVAAQAGVYSNGVLCADCAVDLVPALAAKLGVARPARKPVVWAVGDRAGSLDAAGRGFDAVITVERTYEGPGGVGLWLHGKDALGRATTLQACFCRKLKPVKV